MTDLTRATSAEQHAYRALTDIIRDLGQTDTLITSPETLAGQILTQLTERGYSVHAAPHAALTPPRTLDDVTDRLWTMSGPASDAASRTVEVDRKELRDLAAAIAHRAQDTWPFSGDLLDYNDMSGEALAWRALLAVLATTGTTAVIPVGLMPPHAVFQIVSGFTLHPDIHPYPSPGAHVPPSVLISAERKPLPHGCVAANDHRVDGTCNGPADHQVRYYDTDGSLLDTLSPVCQAHATALVALLHTPQLPLTATPITED